MFFLKKKVNLDEVEKKVQSKNFFSRYCFMIAGIFLSALSFNLFFEPYNIVTGGTTGIALIVRSYFDIDPATFVFMTSMFLILMSFIFLGFKQTMRTLVGVLLLPFFMKTTAYLINYIDLSNSSMLLLSIYGGVLGGFASGITYKNGFSTGGMQIVNQILNKYAKISIGSATLITNILIIIVSAFVFGVPKALYGILALYISSVVTDRVILGISDKKAFYIVTRNVDEIKKYIIKNLSHSVTILDVKGGYSEEKKKMIICVIPTRQYFSVKQVVLELDKDAFFLITDTYEVSGGA